MENSFVELNGRDRAKALFDHGTARELVGPLDNLYSPHLMPQGIVPESDDGIILMKGQIEGLDIVVISMEGAFQGGGIGEVGGAKVVAALEQTLKDNQKGCKEYSIIVFDTGGVRLQEANYGLLSISEIQNMIIALKKYVPVIGVIPGRVGAFGGMSITSAMMSYLIATDEARVALNGPEVIEQEAGVREFDSSDKDLIWDTLGTKQRAATGLVDEIVDDNIDLVKDSIVAAIREKKDSHRAENVDFYLSLLKDIDFNQPLDTKGYRKLFPTIKAANHHIAEAHSSTTPKDKSRGRLWFEKLTRIKNAESEVSTVLHATVDGKEFIAIVPDTKNERFPRVRAGEVGLMEGFTVAKIVNQVIEEDQGKEQKRPIVCIVDVPSQAYGYKEELIGINVALASSATAYAKARQAGHPVIDFIPGDAVSGGFLAHGLQSNRMIALGDDSITIQAMSKASAARITLRTIEELEEATKHVPAMAYDVFNYTKLGALYKRIDSIRSWDAADKNVARIQKEIDAAIESTKGQPADLSYRYTNEIAVKEGRVATLKMRKAVEDQWNS